MEIVTFWGNPVTEENPLTFRVPDDGILELTQMTLAGPCTGITSLYVRSVFVGEADSDDDSESDKESIEEPSSDSDDSDSGKLMAVTPTLAVGHLSWGRQESSRISLTFGAGERITFEVSGDGEIHLAGHVKLNIEEPITGEEEEEEEEEYDEEDEEYDFDSDVDMVDVVPRDYVPDEQDMDSDEGETLYQAYLPVGESDEEDEEESEEDDDFQVNPKDLSDEEMHAVIDADDLGDSDDDSQAEHAGEFASSDEDETYMSVADVRKLLLGDHAGSEKPEEDSDDELDTEALYRALAADSAEDGEDVDEDDIVAEVSSKKRRRTEDPEMKSPHSKKHKKQENGHHNKGKKQWKKNNKKF